MEIDEKVLRWYAPFQSLARKLVGTLKLIIRYIDNGLPVTPVMPSEVESKSSPQEVEGLTVISDPVRHVVSANADSDDLTGLITIVNLNNNQPCHRNTNIEISLPAIRQVAYTFEEWA
jgi:hypothetical protein